MLENSIENTTAPFRIMIDNINELTFNEKFVIIFYFLFFWYQLATLIIYKIRNQ
jgi:hypothetical protein